MNKNYNIKLTKFALLFVTMLASLSALAQPLSGVYTVYGTTPSYATLAAAVTDLNNKGVSGPVVFKIRSGSYTAQASINNISGASAVNTITFESETGNAANVTLSFAGSSTTNNYIFKLNSARYITVRNLTLNNTGVTYGTSVDFVGPSSYNVIENCIMTGNTSTSTSLYKSRVYASSHTGTDNIIRNNTIERGSAAIYWRGSSTTSLSSNTEFTNNAITEPYYYGIYTYYTKSFKAVNNTINRTGAGTWYGFYTYYADEDYAFNNNTMNLSSITGTTYPFYFYYCDGLNNKRGEINNNKITVNSSTSIYNYIYYGNYYSVSNNVISCTSTSGTVYPLYNYASNGYGAEVFIEGNDIYAKTTSGTMYLYGHYYGSGCKLNNNNIHMENTTGSQYLYGLYYSDAGECNNNKITRRSTTGSQYNYIGYYSDASSIWQGNVIDMQSTSSGVTYNYMGYYCDGATVINNDIKCQSGTSSSYGLYAYFYNLSLPVVIKNNKVVATSGGTGTCYGLYHYYLPNGEISNNSVYTKTNGTNYTFIGGYYKGGTKVLNNSLHSDATGSTNYTFYCYNYNAGEFAYIRNNVISRSSGTGYMMYFYSPTFQDMDYNNMYSAAGGTYIYLGQNGAQYTSLTAWRAASGQDRNSLSYNPGFTNVANGDLTPNASNPNSWSLNGRGVQIAGNDKDINGNARALTTVQGVPDIGAYEFTPTSTPPNCTAAPAAPAVSTNQVFTFGEDTVAVFKWGATVPTGFALKQYTGTNPPGVTSINPTQMFFYVDAAGTGTNLDYTLDLYYKDPWMGTIGSEYALRLAEKVGTNAWSGYSSAVSGSNVTRNIITTPGVMDVGALFTGIDVPNNAGVDAIIDPMPPFCAGSYTVRVRIKNNGNNKINNVKIAWELDGVPQGTINHNNVIDINGSLAGNEATITLGAINFTGKGRNIKVWTFEPNGMQDPVAADDTLQVTHFAALAGTYTIGGVNPDFQTPVTAVNALNQFGTCGDVIFDIRPGTYTGKLNISNPVSANATQNRVTFRSENGNANSVIITANTTNSDMAVIQLNDADNFTFSKLTVNAGFTSNYGQCFALYGATDNDSIVGCNLNATTATTTSYNAVVFAYSPVTGFNGKNLVIKDNVCDGGYFALYIYNNNYTQDLVVDNNVLRNAYYYNAYIYYSNGLKFTNNKSIGSSTTYYGALIYYPYQSPQISGNEVVMRQGYGLAIYYTRGTVNNSAHVKNNAVSMIQGGTANYGLICSYAQYADVLNNSVSVTNNNTNCYAGYFFYSSSTYSNNRFMNNVFSNTGGGYALYYYLSGASNTWDYNNYYATGSNLAYLTSTAYKDFGSYVAAAGDNKNSLSYDPGFMSATDLRPDKNNAASWSLNGRAVHISGNDKDKDGNTRVEARADGVPDIGAYEFKPEVIPPLAKAVPATPVAGGTQVFTFGERPVARVTWDASFPLTAPLEVRQYSGEKGMGVASQVAPDGSMYFYTDIAQKGNGTTYKFDAEVDYMDIWLGDIASEGDLRLAHKYNSNFPWMVYSGAMSTANTTTDVLSNNNSVMSLHHFGAYTGLENGSAESAFVVPQGSIVICTGNSVQLNAEPQTGDAYQWYKNGTMISGATGLTYQATQAGDYSVAITYGTKVVEAVPVTVSTIAPPNALVSANGPLTYCVGNGLTLDAGNAQGVSYQWQLNGNNISGATGSTYGVNQSGNYTVVVTNIGCSSTSTVTAVSSGPLTVDLGNDTSYCEVKGVYAQLDAGFPGAKYLWSTGDTTKSIEVRNSGTYWVEVDGGPNCTDRDQIEVTISPLPSANGISYVKNGNTYFFSPSGPINTTGYMWLFSDGSTSTQKNVSKTLNSEDLYVRLVLFNNCGTDTVQLGWKLGVEEAVNAESVSLYPNPAKNQVTVSVTGTALEEVEVVNGLGSVVYRSQVESGKSSHRVDLSNLSNGHYMLRARTTEGMLTRPFDVMK